MEATGRLEVPLVSALAAAGLPVSVVNPRQVRDFAKATGRWAKTEAIDAAVRAQCAEAVRPTPRPVADEATQELRALLTRRRQLLDMRTAEQPRLNGPPDGCMSRSRPASHGWTTTSRSWIGISRS